MRPEWWCSQSPHSYPQELHRADTRHNRDEGGPGAHPAVSHLGSQSWSCLLRVDFGYGWSRWTQVSGDPPSSGWVSNKGYRETNIFFWFIFISWRLITLQYCSGVCHQYFSLSILFSTWVNEFPVKNIKLKNLDTTHQRVSSCKPAQVLQVIRHNWGWDTH